MTRSSNLLASICSLGVLLVIAFLTTAHLPPASASVSNNNHDPRPGEQMSWPALAQSSLIQTNETPEAYFRFECQGHPETFIFKLTDSVKIQQARDILSGRASGIVTGVIIRQPVYYNPPWSFHLDPQSISFPEAAIELCDSDIRGIEDHLDAAYPAWCPWNTHLIGEVSPPPKPGTDNLNPTISLTQPFINNLPRMTAPVTMMLKANADDADGTISKVEFYEGDHKIGEDTTYPYSVNWSNVPAGTYLLSARATDNEGAVTSSRSIIFQADAPLTNPIDQTTFFVWQHYLDFLNREPDPPGYQGWQNILNNCAPNNPACDRIEVSSAFFRSPEFQERGYFIYRFYSTALGRFPHYAEFMPDLQRVSGFQSPQQLEASKIVFINDFMARQEFKLKYDSLTDPAAYVNALVDAAGVNLPTKDELIADLQAGRKTRAEVLRSIAESAEVYQKYYNQSFVVMQYFGYLRRDPDALYQNWIQTLNNTGDYRVMVNGFVNSLEYRRRFGP